MKKKLFKSLLFIALVPFTMNAQTCLTVNIFRNNAVSVSAQKLKKIEERTLYLIEQNKKIEKKQQEIKQLKKQKK